MHQRQIKEYPQVFRHFQIMPHHDRSFGHRKGQTVRSERIRLSPMHRARKLIQQKDQGQTAFVAANP